MSEELYLNIKFKNRKTGELRDGYIKIPDLTKYANGMKKYFDIHQFRVCERRLISKEEYDSKGK